MKKILFSLIALLPLLGFAQSEQVDLMQVIPNDPQVRTGTLESGIKYYLRHNAKDPQRANFHIVFDVGAIQEEDNQNGLAHFLEHMAFNGSKNFKGNAMIDYLQSIGVRFGENLNAGTGQELTTYMITNVPITRQSIIDSVLLVLHDWAGFINLDPKDIDEERGVIREEWRQGQSAARRITEKQYPTIFNNSIYAKRNVIGNEEVLKSFTYDDLKSFYKKWYRPDMQAFIIVGDFDVDQMEAKLKATMADIKPTEVKTPKAKVIIPDNATPLVNITTDPEQAGTEVTLLYRNKPIPKQYANYAIAEKNSIITTLISTILNERLSDISKKENAPFLAASGGYFAFVEPFNVLMLRVNSKDNQSLQALEAAYTELLKIQRGGFSNSEFERARTNILSLIEREYNNRNDRRNGEFINKYMDHFRNNTAYPTAEYEMELDKKILATTTLQEVNAMVSAIIHDPNSAVMIAAPASSEVPTEAQVLETLEKTRNSDIKINIEEVEMAPLLDPSTIKAGKVVKEEKGKFESTVWTLSNGVRVVVKPTTFKADEVQMKGTQWGGTSTIANLDDLASLNFYNYFAGNAGLAGFTQSELNKMLTGKIIRVNVGFGEFTFGINGSSTPKDIETMLQLTYMKFTAPRFEQTDLNVVKNQWKSMLPNIVNTPDYIFAKELNTIVSGSNPRAMIQLPSMELLDKVSLERMSAMYKAQMSNVRGMTLTFTGNFDVAALKPLVEKYIASLPATTEAPKYGNNVVVDVKGVVKKEFKTKMETPKVTAMVIYTGDIKKTQAENVNLAAISHILGIRYTKSIREEAGGTYGVRAQLQREQLPTPEYALQISFDTDASKINELLPLVYKEVDDMVANGVSAENLQIFKEFAAKKFAENNINNSVWTNYLNEFYVWGNDTYTNYLKALEGVTSDTIKEVAARAFSQKNVVTLIQLPE